MRWCLLLILIAARMTAADVGIALALRWGDVPLNVPTKALHNEAGQTLRLTRFSALMSNVTLTAVDGSVVSLAGQYGYFDAETGRMMAHFEGVPVGDYTAIGFKLGVPAAVNHGDPSVWPAGHPLHPITNHLHWSWQGGYIFMALEGRWYGADQGPSDAERGFSYHIARDEHVIPVRFAAALRIDGDTSISFALDLAKVLKSQRLAADDGSESTHSAPGDVLVDRLTATIQRSFFWLGVSAMPASTPARTADQTVRSTVGHALALKTPPGFPVPELPADNPITAEGVALGQALFTDVRLSGNRTQSCADCHSARRAFSDTVAFSRGADGKPGARNAMPLFNLAWSSGYAWDGSKPKIRDQAIAAMINPLEMHAESERVVAVLSADHEMSEKFRAAFGTQDVTVERIGLALEQRLLTEVASDSKFDRALRNGAVLTEQEKEGFALFMTEYDPARGKRGADCFHCHGGPLFTDYAFKNNGLDRTSADPARRGVTERDDDAGKFKTPSLRNVAVTGPYMHDGRFTSLEDVVAHYDHGVIRSPTLDPNLAKHPDEGLNLTTEEQRALAAFLRTLTDARWAAD